MVLIWKRTPNSKIISELIALKWNNVCPGIEQTVTAKGENNKAAMIFIVRDEGETGVYAVTVLPVICTFQFAVHFRHLMFPCPFSLD